MKNPAFLICTHIDLSPVALFFKKIYGLKYAVLTHGIECWNLRRGIKYEAVKNADIITTVSKYSKKRLAANNIHKDKIKLLHNSIDASLFYRKPVNRNLLSQLAIENKRVLLTVGWMSSDERYKGHDILLEVLKELGDEYIWVVIGGGDDLPRLKQKAKDLGIVEKVRFLGRIANEELVDYYNLCDVFIMPSRGEGFGIVFLEAMACGKPVIAGNRDGSAEPLINGRLGFLVDPDNIKDIKEAVNTAFSDKEDRTNPQYLVKEVEENFGTRVFNKKVKEIFSDMF